MRFDLKTSDHAALFGIISKQQQGYFVVTDNYMARLQTAKRHDARSVAAAMTQPRESGAS